MARRWERTSEKSPEVAEADKKKMIEDSEDVDPELCQTFAINALESLFAFDDVVDDYDFNTTVFCLFVECIHILSSCEWTADELKTEIDNHIDCNGEDDD
jgi:hypothetical protein